MLLILIINKMHSSYKHKKGGNRPLDFQLTDKLFHSIITTFHR